MPDEDIDQVISRLGIGFTFVDSASLDEIRAAIRPNTKLVHVETPTNPMMKLTDVADTVTEMREVKHAYQKGILAQRGIEY